MNSTHRIRDPRIILFTQSLCYMNSMVNPLIYWLFATNFCQRFR